MDGDDAHSRALNASLSASQPAHASRAPLLTGPLIATISVLFGLVVGDPSPVWGIPLGVGMACAVLYAGGRWPYAGLLVMLGSSVLLIVFRVTGLRSVNAIDLLLAPVLLVSVFGEARREASMRADRGTGHDEIHTSERAFTNSVLIFYALAMLSLVHMAWLVGAPAALDSALLLIRALQGVLFYPLCIWWLRTPQRIEGAWRTILASGALLAIVNIFGVAVWDVYRAGMTLFLNNPDAPFKSPNEAGATTLFVGAVLLVRQTMRPDWKNLAVGILMLTLLALTQSRSAILAWAAFALFTLRWVRPAKLLAGALSIAALLPLLPEAFWGRMARSVAVERGSFEAYSLFLRLFGWQTAWRMFLDHPWVGVGYAGFRFLSHEYNSLRMVVTTVDNYYYEILVSMGVIGLAALVLVLVRLFQLGSAVGRVSPPGTLAYHMARFHGPLMFGMVIANLTGDNFAGMVNHIQMAVWIAVLVRSGHLAVSGSSGR